MSKLVMGGDLGEFDVPSVLQAVGLSRQLTILKLWNAHRTPTGELKIKAGQLLDAQLGGYRGREAFHAILARNDHHAFEVVRPPDPDILPQPLGTLAGLLLSAASAAPPTRPAATAPRLRVSPPPLEPPREPVLRTMPAPSSNPARRVWAEPSALLATCVEPVPGLSGVLLATVPDCLLCAQWHRSQPLVPGERLAAFLAATTGAARQAFASSTSPVGALTLELDEATVLVKPVREDLVAAYVFGSASPLGLVRLVVSQVHPALTARTLEELVIR